jgi:hypothetical protein
MQPGRFTCWKPDSPVAAWDAFYLLHKKIHNVNFFVQKIADLLSCQRRYPLPRS